MAGGDLREDYIGRGEYTEAVKRLEAEEGRQNKRLDSLETQIAEIHNLTISVEKMAVSIENMVAEQRAQGERLQRLETQPETDWQANRRAVLNAIYGAIGAAVAGGIIWSIIQAMS